MIILACCSSVAKAEPQGRVGSFWPHQLRHFAHKRQLIRKTRMKSVLPKLLRLRFAVPLLILAVLSLALVSEFTYRRAHATLTGGIALTDARIGAARLLQLLTDAETAQRGYLLTGNSAYLQPLRNAQQEFMRGIGFLEVIRGIGTTGPADAENIRTKVAAKFLEIDRSVMMAESGDRTQALALVQTDAGKQLMDELREIFRLKLAQAEQMQQGARSSIYTALWFNRIAVLLLSCVLALGLYLHLLQLRAFDRARATYQQTLEKSVVEKTQRLKTLATWLETAREDEKAHLARELHDELGGLLTGAKLTMLRMRGKLADNPEMLERIASVTQLLNAGIALKRKIIEDLRPSTLNLLGLHGALEKLCADAAQQLGVAVSTEVTSVKMHPDAELAVFRVVQEALTNIGKYAEATEVRVRLWLGGEEMHVEITDNGLGFDAATQQAGRHGLAGMRFRMESYGGMLSVISAPAKGTRIVASLPLAAGAAPNFPDDVSLPAELSQS